MILNIKNPNFQLLKKMILSRYNGKKVMYIPSERNLISVLDDVDEISGLPYTLQSTYEEFIKASKKLGEKKEKSSLKWI